jgi:hypothetical protein
MNSAVESGTNIAKIVEVGAAVGLFALAYLFFVKALGRFTQRSAAHLPPEQPIKTK